MLIVGTSVWPAVFLGALLVYLTVTGHVSSSITIAMGNTIEAVLGAMLIQRFAEGSDVFRHPRSMFRFVAVVGLVATPIAATFGALAMALSGTTGWADVVARWMTWWLANFAGILVLAPFTTLWFSGRYARPTWQTQVEALGLLLALAGTCLVVFGGFFPGPVKNYPLEFLCVPFLVWAAFRTGRRWSATAVVVLSGLAVWGTQHGFGPFVRTSAREGLVLVQAYTGVMSVVGVVLASVVAEHMQAQEQLRALATTDSLTGLVNYRRLLEVLRGEIARSARTRRSFAILFVDMNGLKKINDKFGHLVGSRALSRLADVLRDSSRSIDTPARYGGDEFAVVLPESDEQGGRLLLQRIADRLASDTDKPLLSVSGGVAVYPRDGDSPTLLLRAADQLLYQAKAAKIAAKKPAETKPVDAQRTGTLF